jgi:hypothetical protein
MDDARKRILERRARFVAAAVTTFAASACERPQPCLSAVPLETRDSGNGDAQPAATQSATSSEETDAGAPMPCLAPPPATTPVPAPCLSPMPPPTAKGH